MQESEAGLVVKCMVNKFEALSSGCQREVRGRAGSGGAG
jgi:hypothetical protein